MKSPAPPASLSNGANPTPGMVRWTPVEGATAYEVSFLWDLPNGQKKKIKTATTAADLRELLRASRTTSPHGPRRTSSWRVRAVREVDGPTLNSIPVVSYGPWSPTNVTVEPATIAASTITLRQSVSRSRTSDIFDVLGAQSPDAHELFPGFWWSGQFALDGTSGACPTRVAAAGVTCPLFRVYVFTDEDCVNRVHSGDIVGSPAYVPRLSGVHVPAEEPGRAVHGAPPSSWATRPPRARRSTRAARRSSPPEREPGIPSDPSDADVPEGRRPTASRASGTTTGPRAATTGRPSRSSR